MEKFEYRNPRFHADLDARFTVDGVSHTGRCTEISKAGVTLQLKDPLPHHSVGQLRMSFLDQLVEIRARVTHLEEERLGLVFLFETDVERRAAARLVDAIASATNRPGPVLLP